MEDQPCFVQPMKANCQQQLIGLPDSLLPRGPHWPIGGQQLSQEGLDRRDLG
jgi:hypothetical protein